MSTMIDTIFEKGVFRPLKPVALAENQRVRIRLEESLVPVEPVLAFPRHPPSPYPDDFQADPEPSYEYQPVPLKFMGTIQARFVFKGPLTPPVYPEE